MFQTSFTGGAQQGVLRGPGPPNILEKKCTILRKRGLCNFHHFTWAPSIFIVLRMVNFKLTHSENILILALLTNQLLHVSYAANQIPE